MAEDAKRSGTPFDGARNVSPAASARAVCTAMAAVLVLGAGGLDEWAGDLPPNRAPDAAVALTGGWAATTAAAGLDRPRALARGFGARLAAAMKGDDDGK